jgi:hypothetical protein
MLKQIWILLIAASLLLSLFAFWLSHRYQQHLDAVTNITIVSAESSGNGLWPGPARGAGGFVLDDGTSYPPLTEDEKSRYRLLRWLLLTVGCVGILFTGYGSAVLARTHVSPLFRC